MRQWLVKALLLWFCLLSLCALGQENRVIRVGVAVLQNKAGRSVSGEMERDRLVSALNQEKPDKKLHVKVEGVALNGMTPGETGDEARQKKCDYVVYTSLVELQSSTDVNAQPPRPGVGTIQTNPGGVWNTPPGQENRNMNPEYLATVDYRLYRTGNPSAIAGAPFSARQAGNEESAVSQVMNQIANRVYAEVKKAPPPMQE